MNSAQNNQVENVDTDERIFKNIIDALSPNDLIMPDASKDKDELLSLPEKRKMLAFLGRFLYKAHGGFADANPNIVFPKEVKNKFIHAFLELYQDERPKTVNDAIKDIFKLQMKYIPDNHLYIFNSDNTMFELPEQEKAKFQNELRMMLETQNIDKCQRGKIERYLSKNEQVGKNIAKNTADIMSNTTEGIQWKTGNINLNGHNFYVVGISSFVAFDEHSKFSKKLIDDYTKLAHQLAKQEYLKSDALIVDLRQNRGGWPYIGDYLARTLYGNTVTSGGAYFKRDTMERALVGAYMKKSSSEEMQQIIKKSFSERTEEFFDEKWTNKFPFNPALAVQKPIIVLTDRGTGSNAEATCEKLVVHPYVRFVGENTKGCVQFGGAPNGDCAVPLPFGGKVGISLGASASDTIQGRFEGIGIAPNYPVEKGHDALIYAIHNFDKIIKDIQNNVSQQRFTPLQTTATRENYVEEVTKNNITIMTKQKNKECAKAVQILSDATKLIPQQATQQIQRTLQDKGSSSLIK